MKWLLDKHITLNDIESTLHFSNDIRERNASFLTPDVTCSNEQAVVSHSSYSNLSPKRHCYVAKFFTTDCLSNWEKNTSSLCFASKIRM